MPSNWYGRCLAHRCGMSRGMENTLEAIERAYRDGADGFECDVRMTADGVPVVFHDADLKRMADHGGVIAQLNKCELDQVRLRNGAKIPSVAEVMDFVKNRNWRVMFEIKDQSFVLAKQLVKLSREHHLYRDQCQFLTFAQDGRLLVELKKAHPLINTSIMFKVPWRITARAKKFNADTVCVGWLGRLSQWFFYGAAEFSLLRDEIKKAHSHNLEVIAGITAEPDAARYLAELGVDGIFSNDIPTLHRALMRSK